jgi:hypothetical protein
MTTGGHPRLLPIMTIHPLVEALARADAAQRRAIVAGLKMLREMLEKT